MRVLVTEQLSDQGLDLLRRDFQVDVRTDLAAGPLATEIAPYDALIIRSATRVTDAVLGAATNLKSPLSFLTAGAILCGVMGVLLALGASIRFRRDAAA